MALMNAFELLLERTVLDLAADIPVAITEDRRGWLRTGVGSEPLGASDATDGRYVCTGPGRR